MNGGAFTTSPDAGYAVAFLAVAGAVLVIGIPMGWNLFRGLLRQSFPVRVRIVDATSKRDAQNGSRDGDHPIEMSGVRGGQSRMVDGDCVEIDLAEGDTIIVQDNVAYSNDAHGIEFNDGGYGYDIIERTRISAIADGEMK